MAADAERPAAVSVGAPDEGRGYWSLVWIQFRKNRIASVSAVFILILFWLAAWGPLLANGRPFYWRELDPRTGALRTSWPLLEWLTAPSEQMSVDYLFNYFFFLTLTVPLLCVPVWWWSRGRVARRKQLHRRALYAGCAAVLLAVVPFIGPGVYEVSGPAAAPGAAPQAPVTAWHFFRRHRLESLEFLLRRYRLDATKGETSAFPPVAQDPVAPTREILHPGGQYLHFLPTDVQDREAVHDNWRVMSPEVLRTANLPNIRRLCFRAVPAAVEGDEVRLSGVDNAIVVRDADDAPPRTVTGHVRCSRPAVLAALKAAPANTEFWLFGEHSAVVDDHGRLQSLTFDLLAVAPATAPIRSFRHWLGTDREGRDVLARLIHGARISMSVGFVSVTIATLLGILIGGLAGYYRGWVDVGISRFIELVICFPTFFLIITIIAFVEERSIFHVMLVMGLTGWTGVARLVRGEFLRLSGQDFVQAARGLGCSGRRIMFRHILPNAMGPVLVSVAFGVASSVLTESGLAFLGFGAPPPTPTWGEMISQGHAHVLTGAWWLFLYPGLLIFLTVTVYNLAGDGMRDAMDPRLRK